MPSKRRRGITGFFLYLESQPADMEWKSIQTELRRLSALVDGWAAAEAMPPLERDLALDKLRAVYEALRFAEVPVAPLPINGQELTPAPVAAFGIDLEEMMASPTNVHVSSSDRSSDETALPDGAVKTELSPARPEIHGGDSPCTVDGTCVTPHATDASSEPGREPLADMLPAGQAEIPAAPDRPAGLHVLQGRHSDPVSSPSAAPGAEGRDAVPDSPRSEHPVGPNEPVLAESMSQESATKVRPSDAPAAVKQEPVLESLFDPDDFVDRRRKNRRVILSLYGEEEDLRPATPVPGKSRHDKRVSPGREPSAALERPADATAAQPARSDGLSTASGPQPEAAFPSGASQSVGDALAGATVISPEGDLPDGGATGLVVPEPASGASEMPATASAVRDDATFAETRPLPLSEADREAAPVTAPLDAAAPVEGTDAAATLPVGKDGSVVPSSASDSPGVMPQPQKTLSERNERGHQVLGEVIGQGVQTLADRISPPLERNATLAGGEPVEELRKAIGVNDRFLMIRDLFAGNAAAYEQAIDRLEQFDDLDDCMIHLTEQYAWDPNSDGARLLTDLLERKLG